MTVKSCPACYARMIDGPESQGAWGCTACGGVWAGTGASNRVASVLDPAVRELADVAERHASTARSHVRQAPVRSCPDCRSALASRELAGVWVDVCRVHGTWFDGGELQRVADARLGKKEAASDDDDPKSARWKPDTATDVAADVALVALRVFFSILEP